MNSKALILLGLLHGASVHADTVARFGGLFPVIETDIRLVIAEKLAALQQSGALEVLQKEAIARVEKQIERPKPSNIPTTTTPQQFYVDPSIEVNEDILGADGLLIAKKGTRINPFERIHFSKALIFINADDARQVDWVKREYRHYEQVKFILTGGSIRDAQALFGRVYFDLNGEFSAKLHINHVPSVVIQEGLQWKVTEGAIL